MTQKAIKLFYSYSHKDEDLRDQLDTHLALLRRQGLIEQWYDRNINAGREWAQEIDTHLQSADIILLLISTDFIASEYCYSIEMKEALRRREAGEARVIPVILRQCDWESSPFAMLQALPRGGKPVKNWTNRDSAFTDVAKGIRRVIEELQKKRTLATPQTIDAKEERSSEQAGFKEKMKEQTQAVPSTPTATTLTTPLKNAIRRYYAQLKEYEGKANYEMAIRTAFLNLLAEGARLVKWTLIPEQTLEGGIRPDGVLRDDYFMRGCWEAKGPDSNLDQEITKKIAAGYPLNNAIFENSKKAVLYQNKKRFFEYDLRKPNDVSDLLKQFLTYTEPDIETFEAAVREFQERIPELAQKLLDTIEQEHKTNKKFIAAFSAFMQLCRTSLNPTISKEAIDEMLVQHLLTERLLRTVFNNPDFVKKNIIASEIEKVILALTARAFDRNDFLKKLDRFYVAIEAAAKGRESWSERQSFLNTVYERFFQGFSVRQADTHGIVYTPQEIVDFMCNSVEEVLQKEFGTPLARPGVQILDPATGTGNFIVNLMRNHIPSYQLKHKYRHDLFCNEITLLPYYIASLNIEHEYFARTGEYEAFEGICFADTLELAEGKQLSLFVEENTVRVQREKDAQIMVVIGNPPYNVGQVNENDNNKNRKYPKVDERIRETYAKTSKASNKNALSDVYVKFFRWATDRLQGRDGIVCFVTNNSFVDQIAFDGMRMALQKEFTQIYHLDLHGNVRKNPKLSGTTHNVFGIQIGVGITIAIRNTKSEKRGIYYYRVSEDWRKTEKYAFLVDRKSLTGIEWLALQPDQRYTWITEGLHSEFATFVPVGTKEAKADYLDAQAVFKNYGRGVATCRDDWVYDYDRNALKEKVTRFIETYNSDLDKWRRRGKSTVPVDDFVTYDDAKIKWSRDLKLDLQRGHYAQFKEDKIRVSLYRPFCKQYLFFDRILNEEVYQQPKFFPTPASESENVVICVSAIGSSKSFHCLAANCIPDLHTTGDAQCFPYYVYAEDGSNRRENITDWALTHFQAKYGSQVTKWDIFHYVYGMLHHPHYRERYKENLKRDLPHIPLVHRRDTFLSCVHIGQQLMDIHLTYERQPEYELEWLTNDDVPFSWHVEKMRLSTDGRVVVVNPSLRLGPLPPECFEYRLGNRSALEWVIDQYQVTTDKRSGIVSDPNQEDEEYIVRLVRRVVTVSVETVKLVKELEGAVKVEDWLDDSVDIL
jgi:predicted helicase